MTHTNRFLPYPELVDPRHGGRYRILDSAGRSTSGSVDKLHRRMWVPLKASGRPVVRHELAHVLWSPPKLPRVRHPIVYLQAVEDARINTALARLGMPVDLDAVGRAHVHLLGLRDLENGRACDFVVRWVASSGTNVEPLLADAAGAAGLSGAFAAKLVAAVRATLERRRGDDMVAPFEAARAAARELARRLLARGRLDPAFRNPSIEISCCTVVHDKDGDDLGFGARPEGEGEVERGSDGVGSGFMEVVEAPLSLAHPAAHRLRPSWRAATEGSRLGSLHRWSLDKAVFKRRARKAGGTVLIDTSGSMSLGDEDMDRLLEASRGAAQVAIYSGRDDRGELRVVARNGRRAEKEQLKSFGGGNIVDAPALEWLSRQALPRIWISDGGVTGIRDRSSDSIDARCAELCRSGKIARFEDSEGAARALSGRASL